MFCCTILFHNLDVEFREYVPVLSPVKRQSICMIEKPEAGLLTFGQDEMQPGVTLGSVEGAGNASLNSHTFAGGSSFAEVDSVDGGGTQVQSTRIYPRLDFTLEKPPSGHRRAPRPPPVKPRNTDEENSPSFPAVVPAKKENQMQQEGASDPSLTEPKADLLQLPVVPPRPSRTLARSTENLIGPFQNQKSPTVERRNSQKDDHSTETGILAVAGESARSRRAEKKGDAHGVYSGLLSVENTLSVVVVLLLFQH